jgi:hypothetical protein
LRHSVGEEAVVLGAQPIDYLISLFRGVL